MAGILNNKERVIDFFITKTGREQISNGRLIPVFASLTDSHTFYQASSSLEPNIAEDPTNRIFFEAGDRIQDVIVPELAAGNVMNPFTADDFYVAGSVMAAGTFKTGSVEVLGELLKGPELVNLGPKKIFKTIAKNFKDHRILSTKDEFSDTTDFKLSAHTASFVVSDDMYDFSVGQTVDLNNIPNLSSDWRFSHLPNFDYLPPVNVATGSETGGMGQPLGNYPDLSALHQSASPALEPFPVLGIGDTSGEVAVGEVFGDAAPNPVYVLPQDVSTATKSYNPSLSLSTINQFLQGKQKVELTFSDTSRDNNLICQMFEFNNPSNGGVQKLSAVDLGYFEDNDIESPGQQVYCIGRIEEDSFGCSSFIGLFIVVFD